MCKKILKPRGPIKTKTALPVVAKTKRCSGNCSVIMKASENIQKRLKNVRKRQTSEKHPKGIRKPCPKTCTNARGSLEPSKTHAVVQISLRGHREINCTEPAQTKLDSANFVEQCGFHSLRKSSVTAVARSLKATKTCIAVVPTSFTAIAIGDFRYSRGTHTPHP